MQEKCNGFGMPAEAGETVDDLAMVRLKMDVALRVLMLVDGVAETIGARSAIVVDIADCWLALPGEVRRWYVDHERPHWDGLAGFASDYIDSIDVEIANRCPDLKGRRYEDAHFRYWQAHIERIEHRLSHREPVPVMWLNRFPHRSEPATRSKGARLAST